MISKKELLKEEKDCASMLGMTLEEYREYTNNTKCNISKKTKEKKYNNSILSKLGLNINDLKTRKVL